MQGMDMNSLNSQAGGGSLNVSGEFRKLDADPGDKSMGENFQIAFTYLMSIRKPSHRCTERSLRRAWNVRCFVERSTLRI